MSTGRTPGDRDAVFGPSAPPTYLALPASGNVTIVEVLTFLPNSIRNSDICDRIVYNGLVAETIANIYNHHRHLPRDEITVNTALKMLQWSKRYLHGYTKNSGTNWTPSRAYEIDRPATWDATKLSLEGFKLNVEYKPKNSHTKEDGVPFEQLDADVDHMPTEYDTLDLTRCVEYAMKHPNMYVFPCDFASLTEKLGGPRIVKFGHLDRAAAARWTQRSNTFRRRLKAHPITEDDGSPVTQASSDVDSGDGDKLPVPQSDTEGMPSAGEDREEEADSRDEKSQLANAAVWTPPTRSQSLPSFDFAQEVVTNVTKRKRSISLDDQDDNQTKRPHRSSNSHYDDYSSDGEDSSSEKIFSIGHTEETDSDRRLSDDNSEAEVHNSLNEEDAEPQPGFVQFDDLNHVGRTTYDTDPESGDHDSLNSEILDEQIVDLHSCGYEIELPSSVHPSLSLPPLFGGDFVLDGETWGS
ncbi:hypothetical protein N0V94_004918 [Neodidymelliopsis sp. IMI 364377]|nr:hypothetical protein N0V94_004918 [Neodidymelliopsis sp. IMI 364377]